jgi:hypothetical protein
MVSGQLHVPVALARWRGPPPGTHWVEGWVGLRVGLDAVEKRQFLTLPGLELRPGSCNVTVA